MTGSDRRYRSSYPCAYLKSRWVVDQYLHRCECHLLVIGIGCQLSDKRSKPFRQLLFRHYTGCNR
jgi:hypothetical protein